MQHGHLEAGEWLQHGLRSEIHRMNIHESPRDSISSPKMQP